MRKFILSTVILCIATINCIAQDYEADYGTPNLDELSLKEYAPDRSAPAVKLFDFQETNFSVDVNGLKIQTQRRVRIKIFNKNGYEQANVVLPYVSKRRDGKITDISGYIYYINQGGKAVAEKIDKKNILRDKPETGVGKLAFTFPNVQPGCVIEYRYTKTESNLQEQSMQIYGSPMTLDALMREFAYAFADKKYPGVPNLELNSIGLESFLIGDIPVQPVQVWHMKMPVLGFRMGKFTYITDANRMDEAEKEKIKGSEILVVNALRREKHISHYSLDEAVALVQELEIPKAYFTHISHQLGRHKEVEKELPEGIHLAYDGLEVTI